MDLINDLEDISLPLLTDGDIEVFVNKMLSGREVPYEEDVPQRLIVRLGRPIPLFMQMATQDLYRLWKKEQRKIVAADVDTIFDALIVSSGARTRLQHYYIANPAILYGSQTLDCLCFVGTNQYMQIWAESGNADARNGTLVSGPRHRTSGA